MLTRYLCALLSMCPVLLAQVNPQELAQEVLKRFEHGSPEEFAAIVPVGDGRKLVASQPNTSCLAGRAWRAFYSSPATPPFCC